MSLPFSRKKTGVKNPGRYIWITSSPLCVILQFMQRIYSLWRHDSGIYVEARRLDSGSCYGTVYILGP